MPRVRIGLIVLATLCGLLAAGVVAAGPRPVAGGGSCTVPGSHATVQAAFNDAGCSAIDIAAGTYAENLLLNRSGVTVRGAAGSGTILDGGSAGRVLSIGSGQVVTITDLTIRNGFSTSYAGLYIGSNAVVSATRLVVAANRAGGEVLSRGGGIANFGTLTLTNSIVRDNVAQLSGAGIYQSGVATVISVTLSGNVAASDSGLEAVGAHTHIADSLFTGNVVTRTNSGGAGVGGGGGHVEIRSSRFISNSADNGAGILNSGSDMTVIDSVFMSNTANIGGAIYSNFRPLTVTGSIIMSNSAATRAGGIYVVANTTVTSSIIAHNSSQQAAIYTVGNLTMTNVTVSGNDSGTAAAIVATDGATRLLNVTVANNDGVGFDLVGGSATAQNSLFAGNGGSSCGTSPASQGHNLDDGSSCGFAAGGDLTDTDPQLGPLTAAGAGDTYVHLPAEGSPAVDAGDSAACPTVDQRGVARPADGDLNGTPICDIGAVELRFYQLHLPATPRD